jgi:hypothetical protein
MPLQKPLQVKLNVRAISRTIGRLDPVKRESMAYLLRTKMSEIESVDFNLYPTDVEWDEKEQERIAAGLPPRVCGGWLGDVISIYLVIKGSQVTEVILKKLAEQVVTVLVRWIETKIPPERAETVIILYDATGQEIHRHLIGKRSRKSGSGFRVVRKFLSLFHKG